MDNAVSPTSSTQASSSARKIPIVVVPGIMGTRLATSSGTLAWNPFGADAVLWKDAGRSPGQFAADSALLGDINSPLVLATNSEGYSRDDGGDPDEAAEIDGFFNFVCDSYDHLLFGLNTQLRKAFDDAGIAAEPLVFAAGYDWRQDNAKSAETLAKVVTRAMTACPGEKVFIVAHSMGGLVSRYFCKVKGGEANLAGLDLLGSPSLGAPQAYAYLKRGIQRADGDNMFWFLRYYFLWQSTIDSMIFNRSFVSMFQLLPNQLYCQDDPQWLTFGEDLTGYPYRQAFGTCVPLNPFSDCSSPYDVYRDLYTGFTEVPENRDTWARSVNLAEAFHASLLDSEGKAYFPANTRLFICEDVSTVTSVTLPDFGEVVTTVDGENWLSSPNNPLPDQPVLWAQSISLGSKLGDSSVPTASGYPSPQLVTRTFFTSKDTFSGVKHGELPNNGDVINKVIEYMIEDIKNPK